METESQDSEKIEKPIQLRMNEFGLYVAYRLGGGHLPKGLQGSWTNKTLAERAVTTYNSSKKVGGNKHAKRATNSRRV